MVVIRGTRRGGPYEMIGTIESASTVVPAGTSTSDVQLDETSGMFFIETVPMLAGMDCGTVAICEATTSGAP